MDKLTATMSKPALMPMQFDEYCDLIGGQAWPQYIARLAMLGQDRRVKLVSKLKPLFVTENSFLFKQDQSERLTLEKIFLKLSLVVKMVRVVNDSHRVLKKPVKIINPVTVRVGLSSSQSLAPSLWNYKLAIGGVSTQKAVSDVGMAYYECPDDFIGSLEPQPNFYSLGMMLFRALLVNKSHPLEKVVGEVDNVALGLQDIFSRKNASLPKDELLALLNDYLDSALEHHIFGQRQIFYSSDYDGADILNPFVWKNILSIGFRLQTSIPGFSYLSDEDEPKDDLWLSVERVLKDLDVCEARVKSALLYEPLTIDKDLKSLLSELINDHNWIADLTSNNIEMVEKPKPYKPLLEAQNKPVDIPINNHTETINQKRKLADARKRTNFIPGAVANKDVLPGSDIGKKSFSVTQQQLEQTLINRPSVENSAFSLEDPPAKNDLASTLVQKSSLSPISSNRSKKPTSGGARNKKIELVSEGSFKAQSVKSTSRSNEVHDPMNETTILSPK